MYLVSRKESFSKLFFVLCFISLAMYIVLGFYTLQTEFTTSSISGRIQNTQQPQSDPFPVIEIQNMLPNELKHILLWTIPEITSNFTANGQKIFMDNKCDFNNCYITTDKNYLNNDTRNFDAIMFSISTLRNWKKNIPRRRSAKQKYIFYSMVPSNEYPVCEIKADGFFNWTWTYKLYSDISTPFIDVRDLKGVRVAPNMEVDWDHDVVCLTNNSEVEMKPKTIIWYKENCNTQAANMFAKELQMHLREHKLELDMYGCHMKNCPEGGCIKAVDTTYSFYLVVEDSISEDYVTKEVLRAYHHNAVPVIVGGADYSKFLPPGSYIDARLESPAGLAGLLEYIFRNPTIYSKYLAWKNYYTITEAKLERGYCDLCELLNDVERMETYSYYERFRRWWYSGNLKYKCYPKGAETVNEVLSYITNVYEKQMYLQ